MEQKDFWQTKAKSPEREETALNTEQTEQNERMGQTEQMAQFRREQFQSDLLHLTQSAQGRRFLKQLLLITGVFEEIPIGNAAYYAYLEGKRSLGLMLYHRLYALGAGYLMQIQEQK